jgi:peroxiredoxin Q/BCP
MRLQPGQQAPSFTAETVDGGTVTLGQFEGKPLLLMFFRYASCPMCNLRLHDFAREYPRLQERGLQAVAFFHSPVEQIRAHAGKRAYPFPLAADSQLRVYREYGVETSWPRFLMSMALPSFYVDWMRSMRHGFWGGAALRMAGMPADFLIGPDGRIQRVHYGQSIGDHLPIDEIARHLPEPVAAAAPFA